RAPLDPRLVREVRAARAHVARTTALGLVQSSCVITTALVIGWLGARLLVDYQLPQPAPAALGLLVMALLIRPSAILPEQRAAHRPPRASRFSAGGCGPSRAGGAPGPRRGVPRFGRPWQPPPSTTSAPPWGGTPPSAGGRLRHPAVPAHDRVPRPDQRGDRDRDPAAGADLHDPGGQTDHGPLRTADRRYALAVDPASGPGRRPAHPACTGAGTRTGEGDRDPGA